MDFKTAPVEVRKRRARPLCRERVFNHDPSVGARSKFNYINLTKTKLKIVDHTGHSWDALISKDYHCQDYLGHLVVSEKLHYKDLSDLRNYVTSSKKSLDFENMSRDSVTWQKLDYLQQIADGKKQVIDLGPFWENTLPVRAANDYYVQIPHVFPEELFESKEPQILKDLGITIYPGDYEGRCLSLIDSKGITVEEALQTLISNKISVSLVEMVAKPGEIADKFVKSTSGTLRLVPKEDAERVSGIYVTQVEPDITGRFNLSNPKRIPLDDNLVESGIHSSREDAEQEARIRELSLERELEDLKRNASLEKLAVERDTLAFKHEAEIAQQKEKNRAEKQRRKSESKKSKQDERKLRQEIDFKYRAHDIEREKQQLDRDRAMMQHQLEMRNYDRKDQSEGLKSTLGIAAGVVSALGVGLGLFKLFKS